jgi:ketosteroid isomerase-like protein
MAAREPDEAHRLWTERFKAGDLEGLVALYEPTATLLHQPGQAASGTAAIREALGGLLGLKATFDLHPAKPAIRSGDLALLHSSWTLSGTGPDGSPLNLSGTTADVVRRQPDGTWLFAIDNPWGTG